LSFGETTNTKLNRCCFESLHWVMLAFWRIDMCKDWTKSSQCCTKCVGFSKSLFQIFPLLQRMSGKLILFSTIRHNVHVIQFTAGRYLLQKTITDLVVVAKHCNTIFDPATCKHVGQPTQQYFYLLDFMLEHNCQLLMPIFWEWNRKTFLGNFVTGEQDLEKKFFWQWELKQLLSILW